jgi:hypothetical protein
MTTPTTPREPLDLEALERRLVDLEGWGITEADFDVADVRALFARIRELEAALAKRTETNT